MESDISEDYKLLIQNYGNGRFANFFGFPSPFYSRRKKGISFEQFVNLRLEGAAFSQREIPQHAAVLPLYLARGGLFPIGYTDNGGTIFYLTEGNADRWPVVCLSAGYLNDYDIFEVKLSSFIEMWLKRELDVPSLISGGLSDITSPLFCPLEE